MCKQTNNNNNNKKEIVTNYMSCERVRRKDSAVQTRSDGDTHKYKKKNRRERQGKGEKQSLLLHMMERVLK